MAVSFGILDSTTSTGSTATTASTASTASTTSSLSATSAFHGGGVGAGVPGGAAAGVGMGARATHTDTTAGTVPAASVVRLVSRRNRPSLGGVGGETATSAAVYPARDAAHYNAPGPTRHSR